MVDVGVLLKLLEYRYGGWVSSWILDHMSAEGEQLGVCVRIRCYIHLEFRKSCGLVLVTTLSM